jgi:hypothetical protein
LEYFVILYIIIVFPLFSGRPLQLKIDQKYKFIFYTSFSVFFYKLNLLDLCLIMSIYFRVRERKRTYHADTR